MLVVQYIFSYSHKMRCIFRLTDDFASGAARIDEPLPSAELRRETGADEGVQNTMTTISHHRGVAGQLVSLQG